MQAVGILASSTLSALGAWTQQNGQAIGDILASGTNTLSLNHELLARPIWVGAYHQPLYAGELPPSLMPMDSRNLRFAISALEQIKPALTQLTQGLPRERLAIVLGTSTSGIGDNQTELKQLLEQHTITPKLSYPKQAMYALAYGLQQYLGWTGIAYTISTACSSSTKAFAVGQRLLNSDLADVVLVGGVDTLCPLTLNGFDSLESLSASICQPCGIARDGINIGEAAGLFVLSRDKSDVMLLSSGESMDAHHISAPHPDGVGAFNAMQRALVQADISANDIDYLNMHGTATPQNDAMEIKAIARLFADNTHFCLSSTKHKTGHCLGAAGAIEAFICQQVLLAQKSRAWLPLHHAGELDPNLAQMPYVAQQSSTQNIRTVMSNNFAFGGSNASLIFALTS